uniref:Uncharacterized protein n=1 Tax=Moniliophthora roreri TaxID=221103 RepID=A0A0W0FSN3_MONRR
MTTLLCTQAQAEPAAAAAANKEETIAEEPEAEAAAEIGTAEAAEAT